MSKREEYDVMWTNNATFDDFSRRLKLIATNLFVWECTDPKIEIKSDYIENILYKKGKCAFVKDKTRGYLTLECNGTSNVNVYGEPTEYTIIGHNYNEKYSADDIVVIKNNNLDHPTEPTIRLFASRLYEIQRTMDVNLVAQKTPVALIGTPNTILSIKNQYLQFSGNMPFLFGDKNYNTLANMQAIKTDAPFLLDKLTTYKHDIFNECLTYLGINNANTDKKERLLETEVTSNDELIKYYLNCFYAWRKKACDDINNKFFNGKETIKLSVNKDFQDLIDTKNNDIIEMGNNPNEGDNIE